jgi:hypothetical protein
MKLVIESTNVVLDAVDVVRIYNSMSAASKACQQLVKHVSSKKTQMSCYTLLMWYPAKFSSKKNNKICANLKQIFARNPAPQSSLR